MTSYHDQFFGGAISAQLGDRGANRYPVYGSMPWPLETIDQKRLVDPRPLDVSPRGLGLMLGSPVDCGQRLALVVEQRSISLEVVYCDPYLGIENLFRCGLFLRSPDENLFKLFLGAGLLAHT